MEGNADNERPLWSPSPRQSPPSYGEVPLQLLRWGLGRGEFTSRQASEGLNVAYRVAVRGVNKLADLGLAVDVGKDRQATLWSISVSWSD